MIHVVAHITTLPGKRGEMLAAFRANVSKVHAEEGCIEYTATVDAQGMPASRGTLGPDSFMVVEKWASLTALQAHAVAPHMQAFDAATKALVAIRAIHVLEPVTASTV